MKTTDKKPEEMTFDELIEAFTLNSMRLGLTSSQPLKFIELYGHEQYRANARGVTEPKEPA